MDIKIPCFQLFSLSHAPISSRAGSRAGSRAAGPRRGARPSQQRRPRWWSAPCRRRPRPHWDVPPGRKALYPARTRARMRQVDGPRARRHDDLLLHGRRLQQLMQEAELRPRSQKWGGLNPVCGFEIVLPGTVCSILGVSKVLSADCATLQASRSLPNVAVVANKTLGFNY